MTDEPDHIREPFFHSVQKKKRWAFNADHIGMKLCKTGASKGGGVEGPLSTFCGQGVGKSFLILTRKVIAFFFFA